MSNHSKIPSFSYNGAASHSSGYPQVKRPRLSSPMLQDLTNQMHATRMARRSSTDVANTQGTRLMNKYVFGDAAVIEEVKKRERKIMKDIMHLKNAILEIEKETIQIRDTQLPEVQYSISKKITMCNEMKKETLLLASQLDLKDGEIDLQKKNEELALSNLTLQHSIEVQELENELKRSLDEYNQEWSNKLREMENLKPNKEIADEILQLKGELTQVKTELSLLQQQNKEKEHKYETELHERLKEFQDLKKKPMNDLSKEQESLINKEKQLELERGVFESELAETEERTKDTKSQIDVLETSIKEARAQNEPLKEGLMLIEGQHMMLKEQTDLIQETAHKKEVYYNDKFDKMEQEQIRRRRLENSIDELKGEIRKVAYLINDTDEPTSLQVDYRGKRIQKSFTGESFQFTRIIPSSLVSEDELLCQEYEMYHEMCLKNGWNFNLISVSDGSSSSLKTALINFIYSRCSNDYQILLQYVYLSEEMPSQDMLLQKSHESDIEIKLKIEEDSLELDSNRVELTGDINTLPIRTNEKKHILISGLGILKFQLMKKSDLQGKPTNFYFLEIDDRKTIEILERAVMPSQAASSPIGIILKKLLSDTKTFFLFHIDNDQENEALLNVSQKLGEWKHAKTKTSNL